MTIQAISWVLDHSQAKGTTFVVLLVIANHIGAHEDDEYCWPSIERIAKQARCSERGAREALRAAEAMGELATEVAAGPNGTSIYRMPQTRGADSAVGRLGEGQNGGADLPPNRKEPVVSSSRTKTSSLPNPSRASRPRDLLADALARAEGADPLEVPASRMKTLCVKANELRKLNPNITPAEVAYRASNWSTHYEGAAISGPAIVAHWGTLAHAGGNGHGTPEGSLIDRVKARLREN